MAQEPQTDPQKEAVRQFFSGPSRWKTIYREDGWLPFLAQQRLRYVFQLIRDLEIRPSGRALDLGCGCGEFAKRLLDCGFSVVACDSTEEMVLETRDRVGDAQGSCECVVADAEHLPFPDSFFDVVLCIGVLAYLRTDRPAVDEMVRVLVPGGYLILGVRNRVRLGRVPRLVAGKILRGLRLLPPRRDEPPAAEGQPHEMIYRSFNPWVLDAALVRAGFKKLASLSHGFAPRLLVRKSPRIAQRLSSGVEKLLNTLRPPLLDTMGEFYTVAWRKQCGQRRLGWRPPS